MKEANYSKKVGNRWALYDWGNSAYSLCISTAIFPIYYSSVLNPNDIEGLSTNFWGFEIEISALLSFFLSASFLIVALLIPFLSGIADYSGKKKKFMLGFVLLGVASCASLFFFTSEENISIGLIGATLASVGFSGSLVFYNAFLPEIAPKSQYDQLSAKGFALGYIGSVLLLIVCLAFIQNPAWLGYDSPQMPTRLSFLAVASWWLVFTLISLSGIPEKSRNDAAVGKLALRGWKELRQVWLHLKGLTKVKRFLSAFLLISMGVHTIIYMASIYAKERLGFETGELILIILIIQLVAAAGAYLFSWLSSQKGNINTMIVQAVIWSVVCVLAFSVTRQNPWLFYVVAFLVGLVLGGIQSLARATYAKLLPVTKDHASFFSFYEVTEKVGITLGTFSFGLVNSLVGDMRYSPLILMVFFLASIPLLFSTRRQADLSV